MADGEAWTGGRVLCHWPDPSVSCWTRTSGTNIAINVLAATSARCPHTREIRELVEGPQSNGDVACNES